MTAHYIGLITACIRADFKICNTREEVEKLFRIRRQASYDSLFDGECTDEACRLVLGILEAEKKKREEELCLL